MEESLSNLKIVQMTEINLKDINVPNQSFKVFGRLAPRFINRKWEFIEETIEQPYEYTFPNDELDYSEFINNSRKAVLFAYIDSICAGQVRIRKNWNLFCFIEDIAVGKEFRNNGVGTALLRAAEIWAKDRDLKGFMLETQDYNLNACRFYLRNGFIIGSVDNMLYHNTCSRGDLAIFWYKVFDE